VTDLVTGATGFVGSAVARKLLDRGRAVRVFARPGGDRANLQGLDVEIAEGDLRDAASFAPALKGVGTLYHVAADYRLWVRDTRELYAANVDATRDLLRAAAEAGVGRIVYCSSVAVLGINKDGTPSDEETPVTVADMIGHYKRSKFLAEQAVDALVREEGLPVVIVNPSTPVGPRDIKPTPTGRMIEDAACGRMPAYVDTGLNIVHVDDVAEGHLLAHDRGEVGRRYVLGGEDMALREILALIADIVGRKPPRVRLPHNLIMPAGYVSEAWARLTRSDREPKVTVDAIRMAKKKMFFSSDRAKRELGYSPRPAEEAIRDAIDWIRAQGRLRG
jgi:dihydroflavonol-4-reductase